MINQNKVQELGFSWRRLMSVWWLVVWRGMAGGVVISLLFGSAIGMLAANLGYSRQDAILVSRPSL